MEAQTVALTAEQMDALLAAIELWGRANAVAVTVGLFFLAFEIAAFVVWWTLFRE